MGLWLGTTIQTTATDLTEAATTTTLAQTAIRSAKQSGEARPLRTTPLTGCLGGGAFFELGPAPNNAASARNPIYNNVIKAQGQTIGLPVISEQQALVLMIGAAANGNQLNQNFRIVLEDTQGATSYDTWTQTFTDWRKQRWRQQKSCTNPAATCSFRRGIGCPNQCCQ